MSKNNVERCRRAGHLEYYYKLNFTLLSLLPALLLTLLYLNYPSILSTYTYNTTYLYLHTLSVNCPRLLLSCSITFWVPSHSFFCKIKEINPLLANQLFSCFLPLSLNLSQISLISLPISLISLSF